MRYCCQIRRIFTATGNHVTGLSSGYIGNLNLEGPGKREWKQLSDKEKARVFGWA